MTAPVNRSKTAPLNPPPPPPKAKVEAPSAGTGKPKAGTAQLRGDSNLAAGLASKVLNSELAGAGKKAAGGAFGVYEAANSFIDGGSRALQGEFEGMVDLGQASVDLVKNAAETLQGAGNLSKQFNAQTGRLAKLAETISQNLDEGAKFGKGLSMAGSVFGGLGGAVSVKKGVEEIQAGDTVGGSAKVTRGVGNVLDGAAGVTQMVAKSGSTIAKAGAVAGRIAPVLGVTGGLVQAAAAATKTPPDYPKAATGAITAVGSALMPFAPVGTAVGGAMVAGAAVYENWDAIAGAAKQTGDFFKKLVS